MIDGTELDDPGPDPDPEASKSPSSCEGSLLLTPLTLPLLPLTLIPKLLNVPSPVPIRLPLAEVPRTSPTPPELVEAAEFHDPPVEFVVLLFDEPMGGNE